MQVQGENPLSTVISYQLPVIYHCSLFNDVDESNAELGMKRSRWKIL
ncbi:hypothetical protein [Fischerella sp. JS2]|nr:hypothetical protein [Fischerella sp. JS2]